MNTNLNNNKRLNNNLNINKRRLNDNRHDYKHNELQAK